MPICDAGPSSAGVDTTACSCVCMRVLGTYHVEETAEYQIGPTDRLPLAFVCRRRALTGICRMTRASTSRGFTSPCYLFVPPPCLPSRPLRTCCKVAQRSIIPMHTTGKGSVCVFGLDNHTSCDSSFNVKVTSRPRRSGAVPMQPPCYNKKQHGVHISRFVPFGQNLISERCLILTGVSRVGRPAARCSGCGPGLHGNHVGRRHG